MKRNILSIAVVIPLGLLTACQKNPSASISADKAVVETREIVNFTNSTTHGNNYHWDFGDGTTSTEKSPAKSYSYSGAYLVKMTSFSKNEKKSDQSTVLVTVKDINAKFVGSYSMDGNCSDSGSPYTLTIIAKDTNEIILHNFRNDYGYLNATISGNSFIISEYDIYQGTYMRTISANGSLNGNNLLVDYKIIHVYDPNSPNNPIEYCSEAGVK